MKISRKDSTHFTDEDGRAVCFNADHMDTKDQVGKRFVIGAIDGDNYMLDFMFEFGECFHPLIGVYKRFGRDLFNITELEIAEDDTINLFLKH